jgi:hypothetical protein
MTMDRDQGGITIQLGRVAITEGSMATRGAVEYQPLSSQNQVNVA